MNKSKNLNTVIQKLNTIFFSFIFFSLFFLLSPKEYSIVWYRRLNGVSSINFPCKDVKKMLRKLINPFNMTFETIGFTLIAITLIILTINSLKFQ